MGTVYISSTRVDLDDERDHIAKVLRSAGHLAKDSYGGSGDPLVETCRKDVRGCDIYVLLLGRRYGHRPPKDNPDHLSITHLEFREAVATGKPLVVMKQGKPPMHLSDADQDRVDDEKSRRAFWKEVDEHVVAPLWSDSEELTRLLLNRVNEELKRLNDQGDDDKPAITPGVAPPHARLLSKSLLLVHLAGPDDVLAARLAAALSQREIGWSVESWRWNVEDGIDWRALDKHLAQCRGAAVLFTDSCTRFGPQAAALRTVLEFIQRQCGFVAGLTVGPVPAAQPWLVQLGLQQVHALNTWAAGQAGATTADLAEATLVMRTRHPDLTDPRLVGLQCVVVAMNAEEARKLRDDPALRDDLTRDQRRFLDATLARAAELGIDWVSRYGPAREDWQPFGPRGEQPLTAQQLLRDVVSDINGQEVVPRRDQEALRSHRIRLRLYAFDPIVRNDERVARLMPQVMSRRVLVLVDELSLCHRDVRAAATDTLSDPQLAVATVAPFDPPAQPVEAALLGNGVLNLGGLRSRFFVAMEPHCELNLASAARLMRWLRLSIPETLVGQGGTALPDNRKTFRAQNAART
jgi:hypothetical protein